MPPPGATAADVISDFEEGYGVMIPQGGRTGYWSPYNNTADPQNQTPTKPAVAMADKIAVEPGGACARNAFALVGDGAGQLRRLRREVPPDHAAHHVGAR